MNSDNRSEEQHDPNDIESIYQKITNERLRGPDYQDCLTDCDEGAPETIDVIMGLLAAMFTEGTVAELDAEPILRGITNVFHRYLGKLHDQHDDARSILLDLVKSEDISEVASVRLEQAQARTHLLDRRIAHLQIVRDIAIERYEDTTGSGWFPPKGRSAPTMSNTTASIRNAKAYLRARKTKELAATAPEGPLFAVMGAPEINDKTLITKVLGDVRTLHPDMILVHGADRNSVIDNVAARWARQNNVHQIPMDQPDFTKNKHAAPFKRNDEMIALDLKGVIIFPRPKDQDPHGISENLAQKADKKRVPVWRINPVWRIKKSKTAS